ncbi:ribosomal RNA small subunit methyltransferase NEP1 isoform X1 [Antechinus flavipes]|uniref:ribosomal RNA small subunit methyltransferase NEP1 isoform X1 n=1 Tax=Antechinus flavipes TaxID=38775 RepID=UPI002235A5F6|nr:ribosomal RNA small subunit methyltransferase NEP1 isoform X1 [Antechinus flavipes]
MAAPSDGFQARERRIRDTERDWEGAEPKRPRLGAGNKSGGRRLVVVLEGASLETVKVGKTYELLNCDKHKSILLKNGRDPGEVRPDIAHQSLLMLMDSPLNRAGLLQVYIHTQKNVLIEVNPQTRIPRTFDRFCGLMVQLLHKLSVRAADGPQKLLKVIKNPVSDHFPAGCMKIGTSFSVPVVSDIKELAAGGDPIVFVVGAFAHGSVRDGSGTGIKWQYLLLLGSTFFLAAMLEFFGIATLFFMGFFSPLPRSMWTTQKRWYPSATIPFLLLLPVPNLRQPLRKHGVSFNSRWPCFKALH